MKKFNKQNCTSKVRATITDQWGRKITLFGQHAHEWSIFIEGTTGDISMVSFPTGEIARKNFKKLSKKR